MGKFFPKNPKKFLKRVDIGIKGCYSVAINLQKGSFLMFYLTGEYSHQMDTKNRIRIPNKLKGEEKALFFAKGPNSCIYVYYEEAFQELCRKIEENNKLTDERQRKAVRIFEKSAFHIEGDGQGRMVLPGLLKEHAKIDRELVICGAGTHIEIWAKEVYDKYFEGEEENFDDMFNILGI